MNTVRICAIALCVGAGAGGYLALRGAVNDEVRPAHGTRAPTEHFAASVNVNRDAVHAPTARTRDEVTEPAFEPDAPELLQPPPTLDEVLETVNAHIGPDGEYVDRETLAAVLSSDPELGRLLSESEF